MAKKKPFFYVSKPFIRFPKPPMTQKMLKNDKKPKFDKKNQNGLKIKKPNSTPSTRERAKRADQHVYASARNIKKINIITLKPPKKTRF